MSIRRGTRKALLSAGAALLIADSFAGSNGTNLTAHTIGPINLPAASWSQLTGGFALNGSGGVLASSTALSYDVVTVGQVNMDVQVTLSYSSNAAGALGGILMRGSDQNNNIHACIDCGNNYGFGFFLEETTAGTNTARANYAFTPSPNTAYTIRVNVQGNVYTGFLNGVQVWQYTTSDYNTTKIAGLRNNVSNTVTFTNFQVSPT